MSSSESDDNDTPQLSAETLAILQDFQREKIQMIDDLQLLSHSKSLDVKISEDWQLSQFWYDDNTAKILANEALRCVGDNGNIALISCPTLYPVISKLKGPNVKVILFEYDSRFSIYGNDFIAYDYNHPLDLPLDMKRSFDLVMADPPFLSKECLEKVSMTIKHLSKDKIILCSGVIMQEHAQNFLGLNKSKFTPHHKNNLGNEFGCYANYDIDQHLVEASTNTTRMKVVS